ncbi:PPR1C phosphatase, partial [Chunga burmeisteri]|nr:PPR1C phosphatase [Chunga burmeisteri]
MEPNSPKKIQFAVPLFQSQIDPEAAEQQLGGKTWSCHDQKPLPVPISYRFSLCFVPPQSQSGSPKQRKQSVFTPPALKG